MSIIESYVIHIKDQDLWSIELFIQDWFTARDSHPYKKGALLGLINEKLKRYEEEY